MNFETKSLIMYMAHVHEPPAQPSRTQLSREKCNKNAIPWSLFLILTSTILGGLFLQFFKLGFLIFSQWHCHTEQHG